MGLNHSQKTISILSLMRERGSLNYLEIEREISGVQGHGINIISKMRDKNYIKALPKERGQLKRYELTPKETKVLGLYVQEQKRLAWPSVMQQPSYIPPADVCARTGAMRAFSLPSRGIRT